MSTFASYTLLRFEINVRSGRWSAWSAPADRPGPVRGDPQILLPDVSAILLMIIVSVAVIDLVTERIRHRLSGQDTGR